MPANDSILDLAKLKEMMGKIPPAPQIFWTHLLTGSQAYTRGGRNYISLDALSEFKCAPARPDSGMPAFYAVDIQCAEDVARDAMGFKVTGELRLDGETQAITLGQSVLRDLLAIANAEYGDRAGAALQCAFYVPPKKKEDDDASGS